MQNYWHTVVGNDNANIAYDNVIDAFTKMYNKRCPMSKCIHEQLFVANIYIAYACT